MISAIKDSKRIFVQNRSLVNLQDWVPNYFYPNGTYVVAVYENEYRIWRAMSSFTSGVGVFPAGDTIATPSNSYIGQWQEVSPLRGNMSDVQFTGQMNYQSSLTPPPITGNVDNYNPLGLSYTNFLRVNSTGNFSITGLEAPNPIVNQGVFIANVGINNIILKSDNVSSLSNNRFLLGTDKLINSNEGIMLIYDDVSLRWRSQALNI